MHGPPQVFDTVDVVGIDADERNLAFSKKLRGIFGEKRVSFEVRVGSPMPIPTGLHQDGSSCQRQTFKKFARDRPLATWHTHEQPFQPSQRTERQASQIFAVGKTMERAVQVSSGVASAAAANGAQFASFTSRRKRRLERRVSISGSLPSLTA